MYHGLSAGLARRKDAGMGAVGMCGLQDDLTKFQLLVAAFWLLWQ
jgi:hypothetical protein